MGLPGRQRQAELTRTSNKHVNARAEPSPPSGGTPTNNEAANPIQVIDISGQEIRTYKEQSRTLSLRRALRWLDKIARDRQALMVLGNEQAVAGTTIELRHALLDALAVPPTGFPAQEAKGQAVAKYFDLCDPAWLVESMMSVATLVALELSDVSPVQLHRLRELMPFSGSTRRLAFVRLGRGRRGQHQKRISQSLKGGPPTCSAVLVRSSCRPAHTGKKRRDRIGWKSRLSS